MNKISKKVKKISNQGSKVLRDSDVNLINDSLYNRIEHKGVHKKIIKKKSIGKNSITKKSKENVDNTKRELVFDSTIKENEQIVEENIQISQENIL